MQPAKTDHISVSICTYKRPTLLSRLLQELQNQVTNGLFTYSITVVDNDVAESARETTMSFEAQSSIDVRYCVEPSKGIPLARNKAIANIKGNYVAFIDDDETPERNWLSRLYQACIRYDADGVLGPVKPRFENTPPNWIIKAKLFERPSYRTGKVLEWCNTRTGNVLLRKDIFDETGYLFDEHFRHSEDQDLFRRMTQAGYIFIWCDEAVVYETQTPDRFTRCYFLKRALLRGNVSLRLQSKKLWPITKSAIAFLIYTSSLPFLFLMGRHIFAKYLIKDFDHVGRLMAALRFDVQRYLT